MTDENMLRRDRKARTVERWRRYLKDRGKAVRPDFRAMACLGSGRRSGDFAEAGDRAVGELCQERTPRPASSIRSSPKLFDGEPPKSLAEVAERYRKLFAEIDAEWKKALEDAKAKNQPSPGTLTSTRRRANPTGTLWRRFAACCWRATTSTAALERPDREQAAQAARRKSKSSARRPSRRRCRPWVWKTRPTFAPKTRILIRGNAGRPGEEVSRQFLSVVAGENRQPFNDGSGRLELARAIASADNPLTARVLVNRVWMHHFGQGLVRTPSDFGLRSEPPSHPELLDYLASRFVAEGWSIKKLHRWILLSSTYQQSSEDRPDARAKDPENLLVWRMNRRRMDLEALRDSLLFVAGQLDETIGGPAVNIVTAPFSKRRTVYGLIERQNLPAFFRTFDFATPDGHSPQRFTTTVPQQALFLMNSPFVIEQAGGTGPAA